MRSSNHRERQNPVAVPVTDLNAMSASVAYKTTGSADSGSASSVTNPYATSSPRTTKTATPRKRSKHSMKPKNGKKDKRSKNEPQPPSSTANNTHMMHANNNNHNHMPSSSSSSPQQQPQNTHRPRSKTTGQNYNNYHNNSNNNGMMNGRKQNGPPPLPQRVLAQAQANVQARGQAQVQMYDSFTMPGPAPGAHHRHAHTHAQHPQQPPPHMMHANSHSHWNGNNSGSNKRSVSNSNVNSNSNHNSSGTVVQHMNNNTLSSSLSSSHGHGMMMPSPYETQTAGLANSNTTTVSPTSASLYNSRQECVWSIKLFLHQEGAANFGCQVCGDIPRKEFAYTCDQELIYCEYCIDMKLRQNMVVQRKQRMPMVVQNMINDLKVKCPHYYQCKFRGTIRSLLEHEKSCKSRQPQNNKKRANECPLSARIGGCDEFAAAGGGFLDAHFDECQQQHFEYLLAYVEQTMFAAQQQHHDQMTTVLTQIAELQNANLQLQQQVRQLSVGKEEFQQQVKNIVARLQQQQQQQPQVQPPVQQRNGKAYKIIVDTMLNEEDEEDGDEDSNEEDSNEDEEEEEEDVKDEADANSESNAANVSDETNEERPTTTVRDEDEEDEDDEEEDEEEDGEEQNGNSDMTQTTRTATATATQAVDALPSANGANNWDSFVNAHRRLSTKTGTVHVEPAAKAAAVVAMDKQNSSSYDSATTEVSEGWFQKLPDHPLMDGHNNDSNATVLEHVGVQTTTTSGTAHSNLTKPSRTPPKANTKAKAKRQSHHSRSSHGSSSHRSSTSNHPPQPTPIVTTTSVHSHSVSDDAPPLYLQQSHQTRDTHTEEEEDENNGNRDMDSVSHAPPPPDSPAPTETTQSTAVSTEVTTSTRTTTTVRQTRLNAKLKDLRRQGLDVNEHDDAVTKTSKKKKPHLSLDTTTMRGLSHIDEDDTTLTAAAAGAQFQQQPVTYVHSVTTHQSVTDNTTSTSASAPSLTTRSSSSTSSSRQSYPSTEDVEDDDDEDDDDEDAETERKSDDDDDDDDDDNQSEEQTTVSRRRSDSNLENRLRTHAAQPIKNSLRSHSHSRRPQQKQKQKLKPKMLRDSTSDDCPPSPPREIREHQSDNEHARSRTRSQQAITPFYSSTYPSDVDMTERAFGHAVGATMTTEHDMSVLYDEQVEDEDEDDDVTTATASRNDTNYSCTISVRRAIQHLVPNYYDDNKQMDLPTSDAKIVVLDIGSQLSKIGTAGSNKPALIFQSMVAKHKLNGSRAVGSLTNSAPGSGTAKNKLSSYACSYPVQRGLVTNYDDYESILHSIFADKLSINPSEYNALLMEPILAPKTQSMKIAELCFDKLGMNALFFAPDALCALYASGGNTGLSVSSGHGVTSVVPIYEGYVLPHAAQKLDYAGGDISSFLKDKLNLHGLFRSEVSENKFADSLKQKLGYVAQDYALEKQHTMFERIVYRLPDGSEIEVGQERFQCTETLFSRNVTRVVEPHSVPMAENLMISELVNKALSKSTQDIRRVLFENIVCSGGNTMLKGFDDRLKREMDANAPDNSGWQTRVFGLVDRKLSCWIGGSIMASLSHMDQLWITKKQYEEVGPSIIAERSTNNF